MKRAIAAGVLALSATAARADDLRKVIDAELAWMESTAAHDVESLAQVAPPAGMFASDATFSLPDYPATRGAAELYGDLFAACGPAIEHDIKSYDATLAADGKTAWVSFAFDLREKHPSCRRDRVFRVTEVLAHDDHGWHIISGAWSLGDDNDKVNQQAQDRNLAAAPIVTAAAGDASVRTAVADVVAKGIDADAQQRKSLVVFGSAPGERTVDGKAFGAAWKASWVGHAAIVGPVLAGVAPSGTTAWAIANIVMAKTTAKADYTIPFRTFLVFDKTKTGAWSLAHVHLAASLVQLGAADGDIGCGADLAARVRRRLVASYDIYEPRGAVRCVRGHFKKVNDVFPGIYAQLEFRTEDGKPFLAVAILTPDGAFIISLFNAGKSQAVVDYDETQEAVDLDGDGADEILVDGHASARADMHHVQVIDPPCPGRSDFIRYAIDLRPKEIPSYCEGTMTKERAGKATHVVLTITKVVGSEAGDQCLKKGRHVFAWDGKQLVEQKP